MTTSELSKEEVDQLVGWVKLLFDLVIGGMDWGSGFFDDEEAIQVIAIAEFLGVKQEYGYAEDKNITERAHALFDSTPLARRSGIKRGNAG